MWSSIFNTIDVSNPLSDYIGKPVDEIESDFTKKVIEEIDEQDEKDLRFIDTLVTIEDAFLNDNDKIDKFKDDAPQLYFYFTRYDYYY